jgi:hypothetical protein
MKKITVLLMALTFSFISSSCFAKDDVPKEDKKAPAVKSDVKEVQGEVVWIGKNFISIAYERNAETGEEKEIRLDLDPKKVVLQHIQSIAQLNSGDTVSVQYIDETKDFGKTTENKIKAQVIKYIKPAAADSPYRAKKDNPPEEESLSLKGVKSDE